MSTTLLNLVKGDPNGSGKAEDYDFETITLDGEEEQAILSEIAEYQIMDTTEYWVDHDEYGRYLDDTTVDYKPLTDFVENCFIHQGHFVGVTLYNTIHFAKTGVILGVPKSYNSWWVNSRRMDNAVSECKLVKIDKNK